jgi:hypothetical protein
MAETPALDAKLAELLWEPPEVEKATKGQAGTRTFNYADLPSVMKALRPRLRELRLSWRTKPLLAEDGTFVVRWKITDLDSGEWDTGDYPITAESPQGRGAEITYASRYSVVNVTGLTPEGDPDLDGGQAGPGRRRRQEAHPNVPALADNLERGAVPGVTRSRPDGPQEDAWTTAQPATGKINASQRGRLWAGLKRLGYTSTADRDEVLKLLGGWLVPPRELASTTELTAAEARQVLDALAVEETIRADPEWKGASRDTTDQD